MHVTIVSKVLELAANLAYWSVLWLLAKLFGRTGELAGGDASGFDLDGTELDGFELSPLEPNPVELSPVEPGRVELRAKRDRMLTVRAPKRSTTVVVVKSEEGAADVIVSIGVAR